METPEIRIKNHIDNKETIVKVKNTHGIMSVKFLELEKNIYVILYHVTKGDIMFKFSNKLLAVKFIHSMFETKVTVQFIQSMFETK